jgi:quercetin dioxygenase-like cupin family protein
VSDDCLAARTPHGDMLVARLDMPRSTRFPTHSHDQHQLVWAASGVLVVEIGDEHWTLPPNLALWVPAGRPHAVAATRPSAMMGVYLLPSRYPDRWSAPTLFAVSPLLHELLLHLADPELEAVARLRAERVVLDLLRPVTMTRIHPSGRPFRMSSSSGLAPVSFASTHGVTPPGTKPLRSGVASGTTPSATAASTSRYWPRATTRFGSRSIVMAPSCPSIRTGNRPGAVFGPGDTPGSAPSAQPASARPAAPAAVVTRNRRRVSEVFTCVD